jgi:hypothetical protein
VDRHELLRGQTGLDVEALHGVGDRDDPRGTVHRRAVDVAKRSQQVPVVVVARRDEGTVRQARRERSVDVGVDHVGVNEVRCEASNRACDLHSESG